MQSMTGFGNKETVIAHFGKVCFEIRSTNHKALEVIVHLPAGFLSVEDRIKKEIEARLKRGRVVCAMSVVGGPANKIFINKELLKNYISALAGIQRHFRIQDSIRLDTLIHLPGVLAVTEDRVFPGKIWPALQALVRKTLDDLVAMRRKEGEALRVYLKTVAHTLETHIGIIKTRFKKAIKDKVAKMCTDEERANFLKDTDITEEIERLSFHVRNFRGRILKAGPLGKELDFIAQEMHREANTMGAKSCDAMVSARVVQLKSSIEKIREQVQNIE